MSVVEIADEVVAPELDAPKRIPVINAEINLQLYVNQGPLKFADPLFRDGGFPHTGLSADLVQAVLDVVKPKFWLEIGSMLGGSAIVAAEQIKKSNLDTGVVCIDSWTGDVNMWDWETPLLVNGGWRYLLVHRGRPSIFERFLANVDAAGHADIIIPISATSIVGIKLLKRLLEKGRISMRPEVIYLDSAHEPDETYLELKNAWDLLGEEGILMGDDWSWTSVRNDILRLSAEIDVDQAKMERLQQAFPRFTLQDKVLVTENQWVLVK